MTRLGDVPPGSIVMLCDVEYEVTRQGVAGTCVRKTARVPKEVTDRKTGTTRRFGSRAKPTMIAAGCSVEVISLAPA